MGPPTPLPPPPACLMQMTPDKASRRASPQPAATSSSSGSTPTWRAAPPRTCTPDSRRSRTATCTSATRRASASTRVSLSSTGEVQPPFRRHEPTKEEQEYVDAIIDDVRWLGADWKTGSATPATISARSTSGPRRSSRRVTRSSATKTPTRCASHVARSPSRASRARFAIVRSRRTLTYSSG